MTHIVTVKRDGFRRLGRAWSGDTEIVAGELTSKDIKILDNDPMFVVRAVK